MKRIETNLLPAQIRPNLLKIHKQHQILLLPLPSINPEAMKSQKAAFLSLQKQLAEKNPYWGPCNDDGDDGG